MHVLTHTVLEATETSRDIAFCAHAILTPNKPFIIEDARADPRFRNKYAMRRL